MFYGVYEVTPSILPRTCEYNLRKPQTPTFSLTPFPSVNVACGSTSPVTFTVNNVYNSPGTLSFTWNTSGWRYNGNLVGSFTTTSNSITLVPSSSSVRPSSVQVTTVLNGAIVAGATCSVNLPNFNSNAEIIGSPSICLGAPSSFTITNLSPGDTFVWSITNFPALATINNPNLPTISVAALQEGTVQLSCVITNTCGQATTKFKTFFIGDPKPAGQTLSTINTNVYTNSDSYFNLSSAVVGATSYEWQIVRLDNGSGCGCITTASGLLDCPTGTIFPRFSGTSSSAISTITKNADIFWGNCPGNYVVNCYAKNECATIGLGYKVITVFGSTGGGGGTGLPCPPTTLKIASNPTKTSSITARVQNTCFYPAPQDPNYQNRTQSIANEVQIYDFYGRALYSKKYKTNDIEINDVKLNPGKYILNISTINGERLKEIIIVE